MRTDLVFCRTSRHAEVVARLWSWFSRSGSAVRSCVALAVLASACFGGQTGTEEVGKGTVDSPACTPNPTPLAEHELSPLGFAPAELASLATGEHSATLLWNSPTSTLSFGPEQGESGIVLDLTLLPASARFVHYVEDARGSGVTIGCALDEVAVDATFTLTTLGGALQEQGTLTLHANAADRVGLDFSLPLTGLNGAFSVNFASKAVTKALRVSAEIDATGMRGTLSSVIEEQSGAATSATAFTYACWPADDPACPGLLANGRL